MTGRVASLVLVAACAPAAPEFAALTAEGYDRLASPRFSEDGTRIAAVGSVGDESWHLLTLPVEGGEPDVVRTEGLHWLSTVAWDDGLLFYSGPGGIWSVDPSGGSPRHVVDAFAVASFDVDPGGSLVAWSVEGSGRIFLDAIDSEAPADDGRRIADGTRPRFSASRVNVLFADEVVGRYSTLSLLDIDFTSTPLPVPVGPSDEGVWLGDDALLVSSGGAIRRTSLLRSPSVVHEVGPSSYLDASLDAGLCAWVDADGAIRLAPIDVGLVP